MVEGAFAAFAAEYAVLFPKSREIGALAAQLIDQPPQTQVVEMRTALRAKLGDDTAGALFPIADQRASARREKDEAKQIPFCVRGRRVVEPADKEPFGRRVPRPRVPRAVEH